MKRAEITRNFDAIVAFAELEQFIDTPVKFYSTGMSVRLAFSIAAHMEPDILLVDEVLAVGDANFQKKCINKMEDVGKAGRTVIFVSHHMPSILRLCERVILLNKGHLINDGPSARIIGEHLNASLSASGLRCWDDCAKAPGDDVARLRQVRVKTRDEQTIDSVDIRQPVGIEIEYEVLKPGFVLNPHLFVYNDEGLRILTAADADPRWQSTPRDPGSYVSTGWIPGNFLAEGTLVVGVSLRSEKPQRVHFSEQDVIAFQVTEQPGPDLARVDYPGRFPGVVRPYLEWSTQFSPRNGDQTA
jgi:lipopolysaccharide transport system ATP-binding protein